MSQPLFFAYSASPFPPKSPCSSPERPTYIILFSKVYLDKTLAASIVPAIPLALSFAPGESSIKFVGSDIRESISPLIITKLLGFNVPL